eukprot:5831251-Amphidinium_carterae.1
MYRILNYSDYHCNGIFNFPLNAAITGKWPQPTHVMAQYAPQHKIIPESNGMLSCSVNRQCSANARCNEALNAPNEFLEKTKQVVAPEPCNEKIGWYLKLSSTLQSLLGCARLHQLILASGAGHGPFACDGDHKLSTKCHDLLSEMHRQVGRHNVYDIYDNCPNTQVFLGT